MKLIKVTIVKPPVNLLTVNKETLMSGEFQYLFNWIVASFPVSGARLRARAAETVAFRVKTANLLLIKTTRIILTIYFLSRQEVVLAC